jgi:hypothetical protein
MLEENNYMGIEKYYTETIEVWSKGSTADIYGVVKDTPVKLGTFLGVIDKAPTSNSYMYDKDTYIYTDILYTGINSNVAENNILKYNGLEYDIISSVSPLNRAHHLEVKLSRRS